MRRIGVLVISVESDQDAQTLLKAFRDKLQELGWIAGGNLRFDYRWTGGGSNLARAYARELVALKPDLLLTQSVQLVSALRDETGTIAIIFGSASDPWTRDWSIAWCGRPGTSPALPAAVKRVFSEIERKIKSNRVRGGVIEDDRAYIDLSDDELTNVLVGGGRKHGLYFLVDDSVRD